MKKFYIIGEQVEMWLNDHEFYTTNERGNGIFRVDLYKNERVTIAGTSQFSVRYCKTDKGKKQKLDYYILLNSKE